MLSRFMCGVPATAALVVLASVALAAAAPTKARFHKAHLTNSSALGEIEDVIVHTSAGSLKGRQVDGTDYFLGIPFAQPPLGKLRWREPQPLEPWQGVRDALLYGPDCYSSKGDYIYLGNKSEDCLYLNVYRPAETVQGVKLPVMVWLFGGSWEYGGSSFFVYDGAAMADIGQAIVVTTNYRLGAIGFSGSAALKGESPVGTTGNYGLQDQRMALEWVQANIEAFGGDKDNVLLFGESAGAGSVTNHVVLPHSKNLFKRACMESGPPADWSSASMNDTQAHWKRMTDFFNCTNTDADAEVACMRQVSPKDLFAHEEDLPNHVLDWQPTEDGYEMTEPIEIMWKNGMINPNVKQVLLGTNQDEGSEFLSHIKPSANVSDYETWLNNFFTQPLAAKVLAKYPATTASTPFLTASRVFGDAAMACPARRAARWLTAAGIPTYLYHFTRQLEIFQMFRPGYGVPHTAEVPVVFRSKLALWGEGELEMSDAVVSYWTNFAATGNPNKPGPNNPNAKPVNVTWPLYTSTGNDYLQIDTPITPQKSYLGDFCHLWDIVFEHGCQVAVPPISCDGV
eukprot:m.210897 g.210897  ORF g.210897 m.210897 type:complete len:568 (-) comp15054_c0_seq8:232-1935(-)